MDKIRLLWLSPIAAYDEIGHAGGKTFNFYLKQFARDAAFDVMAIVYAKAQDAKKIDYNNYGIKYIHIVSKGNLFLNVCRICIDLYGMFFHGISHCSFYKRIRLCHELKKMKTQGYEPDAVILEWTEFAVLASEIKKLFSHAKIVASEHDVSFVGMDRKVQYEGNSITRQLKAVKASYFKREELAALRICDLVVPHSGADVERLEQCHIPKQKQFVLKPYFQRMGDMQWRGNKNQILFFGAMNRHENYDSVFWFLKNVFPYVSRNDIEFVVLGGSPPKELKALQSERVHILGFVDDITPYFTESKCFVAPLVLGAGIKVKILEAMSAGMPVITNNIGIEGIGAISGEDYMHADTADEYVRMIDAVFSGSIDLYQIGSNAKEYIHQNFDVNRSYHDYKKRLYDMIEYIK